MNADFELENIPAAKRRRLGHFLSDTSGAVTVDWVVLTAAIVGIGTAVLLSVSGGTNALADKTSTAISEVEVAGLGNTGNEWDIDAPTNGYLDCDGATCYRSDYDTGQMSSFPNTYGKNFISDYSGGETTRFYEY